MDKNSQNWCWAPKGHTHIKEDSTRFQGNAQEQQITNMNTIDAQRPIIYAFIIGIFQSLSLPKGKKNITPPLTMQISAWSPSRE